MTISYALYKNHLTNGANHYRAIVQSGGTRNLEGVVKEMAVRGLITNQAETLAILLNYYATIESMVLDGLRVVTPGGNYGVSIKGNFEGQTDAFTPSRHSIEAIVSPSAQLRRTIQEKAQTQKQEATEPRPNLLEYVDLNSEERDSRLTPGGMGQLTGYRLKFDPADPAQGIFFVAADSTTTRVSVVGKNTATELMFLVPASLTPGDYSLEVRSNFGPETLRVGSLSVMLTVS
ncbi:MAG: DUF4469 domain-containing protein [Anaerolineales bacterium]|nr:DUF4469 domain-containing protein [Anaerolineales bacterium]